MPSLLLRSVFCGAESVPLCFLVITIFLVTGTLKGIVVQTVLLYTTAKKDLLLWRLNFSPELTWLLWNDTRIVPRDSQLWETQCTWSSYRNN